MLISNMTIVFLNYCPKVPKQDIFGPKFRHFHFFHEILQIDQFEGADFKYKNIIFKFQPKDTRTGIFGLKFKDFYFWTKLCNKTKKFKDADFKYENIFFKLQSKNTQIRHFWSKIPKQGILVPKFRNFCFFAKFYS